jgi:glutamate-1-semialdehyde 2,1-aminomutase
MTGFRVAYGGAQALYGVTPDLTTLGKIIGGGLPVGAYGGRSEIMELVAPAGPVYQAGTLSGNPLAMSAGIEMLTMLREPGVYEALEEKAATLADGLAALAARHGVELCRKRVGSMSCLYFTGGDVYNFPTALTSDIRRFTAYFRTMLENGVYLAPSQFEAGFVSLAHGAEDIARTLQVADRAFAAAAAVPANDHPALSTLQMLQCF